MKEESSSILVPSFSSDDQIDVDGDTEGQEQKTSQQRSFYQQNVLAVRLVFLKGCVLTDASDWNTVRGDSVILSTCSSKSCGSLS